MLIQTKKKKKKRKTAGVFCRILRRHSEVDLLDINIIILVDICVNLLHIDHANC